MRPIAMGRRNSLFSGSEGGAESWAILASLVNTAKLHELDPQAYLADGLERIVSRRTKSHQLYELLAWKWKTAHVRTAQVAYEPASPSGFAVEHGRRDHPASDPIIPASLPPAPQQAHGLDDRGDIGVGVAQKFLLGAHPCRSERRAALIVHTVQDGQQ